MGHGHAQKSGPKYQKEDIGSICYHAKPQSYDALYQKGTAPSKFKSGVEMDKESGKTEPHHEREEGRPQNHMGEPGEYDHGVVYHALPTKQATHNLRSAMKEGNVTYLKNWHKSIVTSDIDPHEQPMLDPIRYEGWRKAGEDIKPNDHTQHRGYDMPIVKIGVAQDLAYGNEKDTPLMYFGTPNALKVQRITSAANMDNNMIGHAISKAANDSIEPSQAHHARAKEKKYALDHHDGGKTLEEKVHEEHSTHGIGHKAGEASAEVIDFAMFLTGKH